MSKLILSHDGMFHDNYRGTIFHSKELREKVIRGMFSREELMSLCYYHVDKNGFESMTDGQLIDLLEEVAEEYKNS